MIHAQTNQSLYSGLVQLIIWPMGNFKGGQSTSSFQLPVQLLEWRRIRYQSPPPPQPLALLWGSRSIPRYSSSSSSETSVTVTATWNGAINQTLSSRTSIRYEGVWIKSPHVGKTIGKSFGAAIPGHLYKIGAHRT